MTTRIRIHHPADEVMMTAAATRIVAGLIVMWPPT